MLPPFTVPPIDLGGVWIHPFGLCVLAAYGTLPLVGLVAAGRREAVVPTIVAATLFLPLGLPVGHLAYLAGFNPAGLSDPKVLLALHHGFEFQAIAFATFLPAAASAAAFVPALHRWRAVDAVALGWIGSWWWYRLGNTLSHDHPGTASHFALAVRDICPRRIPAVACHDLGLYEWMLATVVALAAVGVSRWRPGRGLVLSLPLMAYPTFRAVTEPLVIRHPHPTFAWVESALLALAFVAGLGLLVRGLRPPTPAGPDLEPEP
jgi:prolipoprotein diacylglyceryltransferase